MALSLTIPAQYGYVLLAAVSTTFVGQWHSQYTGMYRGAAQVPYPNAYVTHAEAKDNQAKHKFNCAQRAHGNFLEHQAQLLVPLLISGLRYPVLSASLGAAWSVARIMYMFGYVKGATPRGRLAGAWFNLVEIILQGIAVYTSWQLLP